jgi:hypothetical protein
MATTSDPPTNEHLQWRYCPNCGFELARPEEQPINEQKRIRVWEKVDKVQSLLDGLSVEEQEKLIADPQRDIKLLKLLAKSGDGDALNILDHNGWLLRLLASYGSHKAYKALYQKSCLSQK